MMYVIMALDLLGYPEDHPDVREADEAVHEPARGRRARFLFPALFLTGVGHGASRPMRWANRAMVRAAGTGSRSATG